MTAVAVSARPRLSIPHRRLQTGLCCCHRKRRRAAILS